MTNTDVRAVAPADRDLIVRLAFGGMAAQTLRAAIGLRVVELLGDGERPAADVAAEAGAGTQAMTRLLRALTALGLLTEHDAGVFSVTPTGALLVPGRPGSLASFVRVFTLPAVARAWDGLDDSVRTGEIAFDTVFGTGFFGYLAQHPHVSTEFNAAMSQVVAKSAAVLPYAYDFGRFTTVTDVGGGDGTLLAAVLDAHPALTGMVFDTAKGLARALDTLERRGLMGRCTLSTGDFFSSVPVGADLYLMKSVLHDWPDDRAVTILRHCREALPPGGRVLIVEPVLPEVVEAGADAVTYLTDLNMLVNLGGRDRTRTDFEDVCRRAGLSVISVTPLPQAAPYSLIEAA